MTHGELVSLALTVHGTIATLSFAMLMKFGDRNDSHQKAAEVSQTALIRLREKLEIDLSERLSPVFKSDSVTVSGSLLLQDGSYSEKLVNPVGSEMYKTAIKEFVKADTQLIADVIVFVRARRSCLACLSRMAWISLLMVAWSVIVMGIVSLLEKAIDCRMPEWIIYGVSAVTILGVVGTFLQFGVFLVYQGRISSVKERYEDV